MKTNVQRKTLSLSKTNIAKINFDHLSKIKGGTRSTVSAPSEGQTNEAEHTCVLF